MDSYMCYTQTIHQEAQDHLRHRSTTAPAIRLAQLAPVNHMPQRRRLVLALSDLRSTIGIWLSPVHRRLHRTPHAGTATPATGIQSASD